jgi:hypothetical protein
MSIELLSLFLIWVVCYGDKLLKTYIKKASCPASSSFIVKNNFDVPSRSLKKIIMERQPWSLLLANPTEQKTLLTLQRKKKFFLINVYVISAL